MPMNKSAITEELESKIHANYAKQSQFQKSNNERKLTFNKGL